LPKNFDPRRIWEGHGFSRAAKARPKFLSFRAAPTERSEEGAARNLLFRVFQQPLAVPQRAATLAALAAEGNCHDGLNDRWRFLIARSPDHQITRIRETLQWK
jgi:hypothetical protein